MPIAPDKGAIFIWNAVLIPSHNIKESRIATQHSYLINIDTFMTSFFL